MGASRVVRSVGGGVGSALGGWAAPAISGERPAGGVGGAGADDATGGVRFGCGGLSGAELAGDGFDDGEALFASTGGGFDDGGGWLTSTCVGFDDGGGLLA